MSSERHQNGDYVDERQIGTRLVQSAIDRFLAGAEKFVRNRWAAFKNEADDAFSTYLSLRQRRARQVRNLIYDIESANLEAIYVPPDVKGGEDHYTEADLLSYIDTERTRESKVREGKPVKRPYPAIIVAGRAGIGKSMFANHLFLRKCHQSTDRIPILVELRELNGVPRIPLEKIIATEIETYDASVLPEQIKLGLEHGLFTLILDGQDEIDKDNEDYYSKVFLNAASRFSHCPIIITGRPSIEITSWRDFETFEMLPMTEKKVIEIIEKLNFDNLTKLEFIDEVRSGLYHTHSEMLGIPLLAIVMLLTFSDAGRISDALHEFYEDAFSALWRKHDARKEGFQRRHYSGLARKEFSELLSAFAASGYARSVFTFREEEYIRHLSNAMKLTSIEVDVENFRKDLVRSTSLCVVDGSAISFCHRTFQEYFAALYVLRLPDGEVFNALEAISDRFETDYVIDLLLSLDGRRLERNWIIPKLQKSLLTLESSAQDPAQYFDLIFKMELRSLIWLRNQYECHPSSSDVLAARDARRQMIKSLGTKAVRLGSESEFEELVMADIASLSQLLKRLEREQERVMTAQHKIFGDL